MKKLLIAVQFLTVLPVKIAGEIRNNEYGESLVWFPVVGAFIGLFLGGCITIISPLPNFVAAALLVVLSVMITGGLHLDGLADTCDGFLSGKTREKVLEIMDDSRLGAMGAIGIVSVLLLKFSCLASLHVTFLWKALVLSCLFSRWAQLFACYASSYAREHGKAKYFIEYVQKKEIIIGSVFTLTVFMLLCGIKGLLLFFLAFCLMAGCMLFITKKIGGMTGDTIGAVSEFSEVSILLVILMGIL